MTLIWLSPGLPVDRDALATALAPSVQLAASAFPPPGTSLVVASVLEQDLVARLASVPGAGALLLLRPSGTALPPDLPASRGPVQMAEASDTDDVVAAVRRGLNGPAAAWPSAAALVGAGSGWASVPAPEIAPEVAPVADAGSATEQVGRRSGRTRWLASAGVVAGAALAAVVVLATQGGATNTAANGFRGGGGFGIGGYGFPGAPGAGGSTGRTGVDDAAREAFLACLQENGVDTSAATSGRRLRLDPSDPATAKAFDACRGQLPQGPGAGGPGPGGHDGSGPGMPPAAAGGSASGGSVSAGAAPAAPGGTAT